MNDARRKKLRSVIDLLSRAHSDVEAVKDDESDAFENMPESMKEGEKGSRAEEILEYLDEALNNLDEAQTALDNAQAET